MVEDAHELELMRLASELTLTTKPGNWPYLMTFAAHGKTPARGAGALDPREQEPFTLASSPLPFIKRRRDLMEEGEDLWLLGSHPNRKIPNVKTVTNLV
jgi:hypothetical protein